MAPPFFWGEIKNIPKIPPKKTSSNSEVSERRIHLGLRWGADVSLAGRGGTVAGQGKGPTQNPIIIGVVFLNSAERHEIFFWMFFFECWDFFKLLRLNRTSNVEQQLKSWQINGKTLEKNGKSGSFLTFSLCLEDNPFHNYVDGQKP